MIWCVLFTFFAVATTTTTLLLTTSLFVCIIIFIWMSGGGVFFVVCCCVVVVTIIYIYNFINIFSLLYERMVRENSNLPSLIFYSNVWWGSELDARALIFLQFRLYLLRVFIDCTFSHYPSSRMWPWEIAREVIEKLK